MDRFYIKIKKEGAQTQYYHDGVLKDYPKGCTKFVDMAVADAVAKGIDGALVYGVKGRKTDELGKKKQVIVGIGEEIIKNAGGEDALREWIKFACEDNFSAPTTSEGEE